MGGGGTDGDDPPLDLDYNQYVRAVPAITHLVRIYPQSVAHSRWLSLMDAGTS